MLIVGAVIGSGIFLVPASIASQVTNPLWFLAVWAGAGILTFLGTLTYAELATRLPATGGIYVFIREAFGDLAGYLYGWTLLLVIQTGAVAALSSAFSIYLAYFIPLSGSARKALAVVVVFCLSAINCVGIRLGTRVQNFLTVAKIATLSASILVAALSSINANILMGSRVYFALARDGLFFRLIGQLHPRFGTPSYSILLQAGWSFLLVLTGTFQQLFLFATFGAWIFHCLTAASLCAHQVGGTWQFDLIESPLADARGSVRIFDLRPATCDLYLRLATCTFDLRP